MKFKIVSLILFSIIFFPQCSGITVVDENRINKDFNSMLEAVKKDRKNVYSIKDRRVGKTGFYYIINRNGLVVFHPQAVLIGSDFKRYWFIDEILEAGSGCISYSIGNMNQMVFFKPINKSEILCLSIDRNEIVGAPVNCSRSNRQVN